MPYKSGDVPGGTEKVPAHGKAIYRSAFNAAYKKYGEERAHAIAWAAVKSKFKKKEGKWVSKDGLSALRDEEAGHPFRGNQYTSGESGGGERELAPLVGLHSGHAKEVKKVLGTARATDIIWKSVKEHAGQIGEYVAKDEASNILKSGIAAGLVSLGVPTIPAIAAGVVVGYTVNKVADKLGINYENAHRLMKSSVTNLRSWYDKQKRIASSIGRNHPMQGYAFGFGDADDTVSRALRLFEATLNKYSAAELEKMGREHPSKLKDEEAGHPFRGNQYTSGESGGGKAEGDHPGKGYSKEAVVKKGVIYTSNVNDAARALYEGKKVELDQPR